MSLFSIRERIFFLKTFRNLGPGEEFNKSIEKAKAIIASQPPKSVLALLDATNVHFNSEMTSTMSEFVKANTPYIKSAAVVGIIGLLKIVLSTLAKSPGVISISFRLEMKHANF